MSDIIRSAMDAALRNISAPRAEPSYTGQAALRASILVAMSLGVVACATIHLGPTSRLSLRTVAASLSNHPPAMIDLAADSLVMIALVSAAACIVSAWSALPPAEVRVNQTRRVVLSRMGGRHGP